MRLQATVKGRVQMVRYRVYAKKVADRLGVIGTVKNQPNGTVFVEAFATELQLKKYLEYLWKGSPLSRVDEVDEIWDNISYDGAEATFEIVR